MRRENPIPPAWVAWDTDKSRYVLVEERRATVEEIVSRYLGGKGIAAIAGALNRTGRRPWQDGRDWSPRQVRAILADEAVTGSASAAEPPVPAVISEAQFAEVRRHLAASGARGGLLDQISRRIGGCLRPHTD